MKRLSLTGAVLPKEDTNAESDSQIVRSAILVHGGPEGEPIEFLSGDGPIVFDPVRIKAVVDVHNANLEKLAQEYGGADKIPIGAYKPILDSHSGDSNDKIIGRLTGPLKFEIRDVPKIGKDVACAIAEGITFLGKDTVDRVKDGRIYHLSIGINEKDNSLGETSTVVEPAAPGAMLLKHLNKDHGGSKMSVDQKHLLTHMEGQSKNRLTKLSAINETLTRMTAKAEQAQATIRLTANKSKITHRLQSLASQGRINRTAYKEIVDNKLTQLAALDDSTLNLALSMWDGISAEQNQLRLTKQAGSTDAPPVMEMGMELAKKRSGDEVKRLRAEFGQTYTRMTGKRLASEDSEDKEDKDSDSSEMKKKMASGPHEEIITPERDEHAVPRQGGDSELHHHLRKLGHHLSQGNVDEAKACHMKCMELSYPVKHMSEYSGDVKSEDQNAQMGAVNKEVDELKTQMSRLAGMVQEMMGAESEEGKHFGEISEKHEQVAGN